MLISKADIRRLTEAAIDSGCSIEVVKDGVTLRFSPAGFERRDRVVSLDDLRVRNERR